MCRKMFRHDPIGMTRPVRGWIRLQNPLNVEYSTSIGVKCVPLARQSPFGVGRTLQTRLRRDRLLCPAAHGDDTRRDDSENTIDDWGVTSGKGSEQSIFKRKFLFECRALLFQDVC